MAGGGGNQPHETELLPGNSPISNFILEEDVTLMSNRGSGNQSYEAKPTGNSLLRQEGLALNGNSIDDSLLRKFDPVGNQPTGGDKPGCLPKKPVTTCPKSRRKKRQATEMESVLPASKRVCRKPDYFYQEK